MLARRIEAEIAAVGLDPRLVVAERGMQVGEIRFEPRRIEPARGDVGDS